jgi:hypothetical protein
VCVPDTLKLPLLPAQVPLVCVPSPQVMVAAVTLLTLPVVAIHEDTRWRTLACLS